MRRIQCSEIWGGIRNVNSDMCTNGIVASLYSGACDGGKGGDIYYVSVCNDEVMTRVAVADVLGHGSIVTETSEWIYRALSRSMTDPDGRGVLNDLNQLTHDYAYAAMTTAVVFTYNKMLSELSVAYAGHPPLLLKRQDRAEWEPVEVASPTPRANLPLGVLNPMTFDQETIQVDKGDRLLLYTDGVLEAASEDGHYFGMEGLLASLAAQSDADLPALKTSLRQDLERHAQGRLSHDDVTLMAIEVGPCPPDETAP